MLDVRPLSQMDPRWKDQALGFDTTTIGKYGCLMTCMTMVANFFGFQETPETVNKKMQAAGGYQGALIIPALLPKALPGMVYRDFLQCRDQPAPLAEIDASLAQGKPVIVEVDYAPNPGLQNHWIVLYGKQDGDYLIRDPYPYPVETKPVTLLGSRYKFAGSTASIIQAVVYLDGGGSPPKPKTKLDTGIKASFPVYAIADGLAIRSETLVADTTLIKRVAIGTKLTVLEKDASAEAKIGILNSWLAVLDPADGVTGYTAAWYVAKKPAAKPTDLPPTGQQKPAENLVVKTVEEAVALRSKPEIANATLIRRVPVNTEFLCLEPFDAALAKVGVENQWLRVQDVTRKEAFIAAWYVQPVNALATLGVKDQNTGVSFDLFQNEPQPTVVRAAVEGLVLRTLPVISPDTTIMRLPIDAEMEVLEPPDTAEPKVGQLGEWLHVRTIAGLVGYVGAWYTRLRPETIIDADQPLLG